MGLPKRKQIRLKDYDYSSNGVYFITICTKNKEHILCDITVGDGAPDVPHNGAPDVPHNGAPDVSHSDAPDVPMEGNLFLQLTDTGKIVEEYILSANRTKGVNIDNYVIMPDHIHLLLRIDNPDYCGTSEAPSPTNSLVPHAISILKRLINKKVGENIFQRSYHDHIIRTEKDYFDA